MIDVVYWEPLLDEAGAAVLDESGDTVLVPMYGGYTVSVLDAVVDIEVVTARTEPVGPEVLQTDWAYLLMENGDYAVTEAGEQILIPLADYLQATMVEAAQDLPMVVARED